MESTMYVYYKFIIRVKGVLNSILNVPYKKVLIQIFDQYFSFNQFKRYSNNFKDLLKILINEIYSQLIILYNIFITYIEDVKYGIKFTFKYIMKYSYLIFDMFWYYIIGKHLNKMIIYKYLYQQNKNIKEIEQLLIDYKNNPRIIQSTINYFTPEQFFNYIQDNISHKNENFNLEFIEKILYYLQKDNFHDENKWFQNFYYNFYKTHIDIGKGLKDLFLSLDLFIKFYNSKEQKNYLDIDYEIPIYTIKSENYSKIKDYIENNIVNIKLDKSLKLDEIHYIKKDFNNYYIFEIQTDNNGFYQLPKVGPVQNNRFILYDYQKNNLSIKNLLDDEQKIINKVIKIFNTKVMMGNYKRPVKIYGILKIEDLS